MHQNAPVEGHSASQSVLLHLVPGFLIAGCYFALMPAAQQHGYPSMMALMWAAALILLPLELGVLLFEGLRRNGRFSRQGVVLYRLPIPTWHYFMWVPVLFIILGLIFTLMRPVDDFLQQRLFRWIPVLQSGLQPGYSQGALIRTYLMVAIFGTTLAPIVEEMYFRGYLLPRMGYAGRWAPLLHSLLFGLYHVWTPWKFLSRTLGILPLVYAVRWRNLNLAIIMHILINALDLIAGVNFILLMSFRA
jgi:membrane protease YdiL (CAAX protease family)